MKISDELGKLNKRKKEKVICHMNNSKTFKKVNYINK